MNEPIPNNNEFGSGEISIKEGLINDSFPDLAYYLL